jgi:hypothetical protein
MSEHNISARWQQGADSCKLIFGDLQSGDKTAQEKPMFPQSQQSTRRLRPA